MTLLSAASSSTSAMTLKQRRGNASPSVSASSSSTTPAPRSPFPGAGPAASSHSLPLKAHGVRAHLAELLPLPRHALFAVRLTIHQLWNVPLVSGEFSVKWKFQHVHRVRRPASANGHGPHHHAHAHAHGASANGRITLDSASTMNGHGNGNGKGKEREVLGDPDRESLTPSGESMLSIPSISESSSQSTSPRATSVDLPHTNITSNHGGGGNIASDYSQETRGRTPYVPLREHHVKWGEVVNVVVQIGVQRDTLELQPCELKLVVEQHSAPGDPDALANPRLGAVYLNLAEYVDEGAVTRRYLLRQSKTNATLQLTLQLTHVGGTPSYKSPPLQKGEVMAGVATLLEKNKNAVGGVPLSRPTYDRALSRPSVKGHRRGTDLGSAAGNVMRIYEPALVPELKGAGLRTTDNIIEAIFNPVPTSSGRPSPFTYYVPPKENVRGVSAAQGQPPPLSMESMTSERSTGPRSVGGTEDADRAASIAPSESERSVGSGSRGSAASASANTSPNPSLANAQQQQAPASSSHRQKWWRKLRTKGTGSRPGSPCPSIQTHGQSHAPSLGRSASMYSSTSVLSAESGMSGMSVRSGSGSGSGSILTSVSARSGMVDVEEGRVRSVPGILHGVDGDERLDERGDEREDEEGRYRGLMISEPRSHSAPQIIVRSPGAPEGDWSGS